MVLTHHPLTLGDFHDAYNFFKKEMEQHHIVISNHSILVSVFSNAFGKPATSQLNRANVWATKLCAIISHIYIHASAI